MNTFGPAARPLAVAGEEHQKEGELVSEVNPNVSLEPYSWPAGASSLPSVDSEWLAFSI